jgi:beta-glucosidase
MAEQGSVLKNANNFLPLKAYLLVQSPSPGQRFAGGASRNGSGETPVCALYGDPAAGIAERAGVAWFSATVTFNNGTNIASAAYAGRGSDVAIVMVGDLSAEGSDRQTLRPGR